MHFDRKHESTARRHLKSPRSLSGRSLHLTLVTKWSQSWSSMTYSHPLCSMSIAHPPFKIWPWKCMVKVMCVVKGQGHIWPWKFKGQGHGQSQTHWSHLRPRVQSICLLFVSWQLVQFWRRYSKFHIWPWKFKVKAMAKVKADGHIWGLEFNQYACFSFRGNRAIFGWDIYIYIAWFIQKSANEIWWFFHDLSRTFLSRKVRNYAGKSNEMHPDWHSFFGATSYIYTCIYILLWQFRNKTYVEAWKACKIFADKLIATEYPFKDPCPCCLKTWYSHIWTRQIWRIWKLRPAYSPETPKLGQNRWCFVSCDLEIWWMTLENNRASLLCCLKLCATFHSHWWIQTGVTVRKRQIWVKFNDF